MHCRKHTQQPHQAHTNTLTHKHTHTQTHSHANILTRKHTHTQTHSHANSSNKMKRTRSRSQKDKTGRSRKRKVEPSETTEGGKEEGGGGGGGGGEGGGGRRRKEEGDGRQLYASVAKQTADMCINRQTQTSLPPPPHVSFTFLFFLLPCSSFYRHCCFFSCILMYSFHLFSFLFPSSSSSSSSKNIKINEQGKKKTYKQTN